GEVSRRLGREVPGERTLANWRTPMRVVSRGERGGGAALAPAGCGAVETPAGLGSHGLDDNDCGSFGCSANVSRPGHVLRAPGLQLGGAAGGGPRAAHGGRARRARALAKPDLGGETRERA